MKKVLVACEESQAVTIELRKIGIEAFSCDIKDQTGGFPDWHLKDDIFKVITGGGVRFNDRISSMYTSCS